MAASGEPQVLGWNVKTRSPVYYRGFFAVALAVHWSILWSIRSILLEKSGIFGMKIQVVKNIVSRLRGLEPMDILVPTCAGQEKAE